MRKTSIIRDLLLNNGSISPSMSENDISLDESRLVSLRPRRESRKLSLQQTFALSKEALNNLKKSPEYTKQMSIYEEKSLKICPELDGRIICIKDREVI